VGQGGNRGELEEVSFRLGMVLFGWPAKGEVREG
jgi:hypothetical protein